MDLEECIDRDQYKQLKEKKAFDMFDKNGDGHISAAELITVLRAVGQNPTDKAVKDVLQKADKDGNDEICYEEYVDMLKHFRTDRQTFEIELREAFRFFDKDGNGDLNFVELMNALTRLGEPMSEKDAKKLCREIDTDGDKKVSVEEFVKYMLQDYDETPSSGQQCASCAGAVINA